MIQVDRLLAGERLDTGEELVARNGRVRLVMQGDGNLVLYRTDDDRALWASDTWQQPVSHTVLQGDGNLVAYSADGKAHWASGTAGHPGARLVLQDDGNLVIYSPDGLPLWASDTVQWFGPASVPGFRPSTHAPLFSNATGWPTGTRLSISVPGLPSVSIDVTRYGLCGGMSFLTRDIFEAGTPQLRGRTARRIPLPLAQHILGRLVDSFGGVGIVARWVAVTGALDHDTALRGAGLFRQTVHEVPGIVAEIDAGRLCPIGIVLTHSYAPWDVFENHVVLVWGYERHGDILTLRTYDPNRPGRDDIVIRIDVGSPAAVRDITTNGTDMAGKPGTIRGFFRLPYEHRDPAPAYIDDGLITVVTPPPTRLAAGGQATVRVTATNTGSTTWRPGSHRLASHPPAADTSWGPDRVDLPADPVDPEQTATFTFPLTAPTGGQHECCWRMVRGEAAWFGSASPGLPVDVDVEVGSSQPSGGHRNSDAPA